MKTVTHNSLTSMMTLTGLIVIGFLSGFSGIVGAQDWTFVRTPISSSGGVMNSMYFIDKNTGWIVGNSSQGDIISTTNGGIDWKVQQTPVSAYLNGIFFVNADSGYAVGSEGFIGSATAVILKTINGGQEWERQISPVSNANYSRVHFINPNDGWAIGEDSGTHQAIIARTFDGETWMLSAHPAPQASFSAITFVDSDHGWIVGSTSSYPYQPVLLGTTDGGQNWIAQTQPLSNGSLSDVCFANPYDGWAVGSDDTSAIVLRTADGGASWSSIPTPSGTSASSVCFISSTVGYLAVNTWQPGNQMSTLYKTTDRGDTWKQVATTVPEPYADKVQVVRGSIHIFLLFSRILALVEEYGPLSKIGVAPADTFLYQDQQQQYTALGSDSTGSAVPITPSWNTTGGTIDLTGLYTATQLGDFTVTASVAGSSVTGTAYVHVTATDVDQSVAIPKEFALAQNYPNPFNPATTIEYTVKEPCHVLLKIYDLLGSEVATLVDEYRQPNRYNVRFDAQYLPTGLYLCQIKMKDFTMVRKLAMVK